jgi:uroporphyrinogen-III synthase
VSLSGKTILVTRARHQASRLSRELEALGASVLEIPAIEIVPLESYAPLDAALRNLQQYQWLIVTSANGVRVLGERMASAGIGVAKFSGLQCVAVGSATAEGLREFGLPVGLIPGEYVAEAVVEALRARVAGAHILLIRAAVARDIIPDELRRAGAMVDVVDAYRTEVPESSVALLKAAFSGTMIPDAVTFTSSSTVTNFFALLKKAGMDDLRERVKAISIGPITTATLRERGWEPAAEANPHDIHGLVEATVTALL